MEFFVFGRSAFDSRFPAPQRYPARQTLEACQAVARLHGLSEAGVVYAQQNPAVIDQGVFHNDVISVKGECCSITRTPSSMPKVLAELHDKQPPRRRFHAICVPRDQVAVEDAVKSICSTANCCRGRRFDAAGGTGGVSEQPAGLELPGPAHRRRRAIREVKVFDLKQSMQNGGGPACLRLRVALQERELAAVNPGVIMSAGLYDTLVALVDQLYRDRLSETDLADYSNGCRTAWMNLYQISKAGFGLFLQTSVDLATMSDSLQLILEDTGNAGNLHPFRRVQLGSRKCGSSKPATASC